MFQRLGGARRMKNLMHDYLLFALDVVAGRRSQVEMAIVVSLLFPS